LSYLSLDLTEEYVNMVDLNPKTRDAELLEAIELLYFGYRAFTDRPDRILGQRGLNRGHHRILYFVGRNPDTSVNTLLEILRVSKQALNGPLRQLVEMDLIAMRVAAHDRRVKELRLTYEGEKLEARLSGTQRKQLAEVFGEAGGAAEAGWRKVMQRLAGRKIEGT
jgi:DNA-binding MarR family transcriptional regulator